MNRNPGGVVEPDWKPTAIRESSAVGGVVGLHSKGAGSVLYRM